MGWVNCTPCNSARNEPSPFRPGTCRYIGTLPTHCLFRRRPTNIRHQENTQKAAQIHRPAAEIHAPRMRLFLELTISEHGVSVVIGPSFKNMRSFLTLASPWFIFLPGL